MKSDLLKTDMKTWDIPKHTKAVFKEKTSAYCLCIPVINEGEKFKRQINALQPYTNIVDIIIADGGSTDNSTEYSFLKSHGVHTLLVKKDRGKLSAQLRMAFAYALKEGYNGIITMDGNGKDNPEAIPLFIKAFEEGYDFIQGSRFIKNGKAINTPLSRLLAIRFLHAPLISIAAHFWCTDTTNGFRGHSRKYLLDKNLKPFRVVFDTYELLAYLSIKAKHLGYTIKEVPVSRKYPFGKIPTKIHGIQGNLHVLKILFKAIIGKYNP